MTFPLYVSHTSSGTAEWLPGVGVGNRSIAGGLPPAEVRSISRIVPAITLLIKEDTV